MAPSTFLLKSRAPAGPFTDDFNRSDRTLAGDNGWLTTVIGGETQSSLLLVGNRLTSSGGTRTAWHDLGTINQVFEIDVYVPSGASGEAFIVYCTERGINAHAGWVRFYADGRLMKRVGNSNNSDVQLKPAGTYAAGSGHRLKVSRVGTDHKIWVDGELVYSGTDAAPFAPDTGLILYATGPGNVYYDNLNTPSTTPPLNNANMGSGYWQGTEIAAYQDPGNYPVATTGPRAGDGRVPFTTQYFGQNANYVYPIFTLRAKDHSGTVIDQQGTNGQSPASGLFSAATHTIEVVKTTSGGSTVVFTLTDNFVLFPAPNATGYDSFDGRTTLNPRSDGVAAWSGIGSSLLPVDGLLTSSGAVRNVVYTGSGTGGVKTWQEVKITTLVPGAMGVVLGHQGTHGQYGIYAEFTTSATEIVEYDFNDGVRRVRGSGPGIVNGTVIRTEVDYTAKTITVRDKQTNAVLASGTFLGGWAEGVGLFTNAPVGAQFDNWSTGRY